MGNPRKTIGKWWFSWDLWDLASGKHTKNYGKSPWSMGKLSISMAIFNSYVKLERIFLGWQSWLIGGSIRGRISDVEPTKLAKDCLN